MYACLVAGVLSAAAPPPTRPLTAPPAQFSGVANDEAFRRLEALYSGLDFEAAVAGASELSQRSDLPAHHTIETNRIWGSSLAALDAPVEAERPFRLLLRLQPDYELPADAAPKIVAVFKKVQAEERAAAEKARAVERARRIERIELSRDVPARGRGGRPLEFVHRLKDPAGAVETLKVAWRRKGASDYSALALEPKSDGWRGSLPGELTANDGGFTLECYVEAADHLGPLVLVGSAAAPLSIAIEPGQVKANRPLARWAFWLPAAGAAAGWAASAGAGVAFVTTQTEYRTYVQGPGPLDTARLQALDGRGDALAAATTGLLITAGVLTVAAAVLGLWFVDWD